MKNLLLGVMWVAGVACGDDGPGSVADAPPPPPDTLVGPDAIATCGPVAGPGTTVNNNIGAPVTWTAAGSPYNVMADVSVNAALTIEPCAVVRIADDRSLIVRQTGSLSALGSVNQRITFERLDPSGSWATLSVLGGGTMQLRSVDITGGGDPQNGLVELSGTLDIAGSGTATMPVLEVNDVTIAGSESNGVKLHQGGGFTPASTGLTISGSAAAPIFAWPRAAGSIPTGTYTGNTLNEIVLAGQGGPSTVQESQTFKNHGVPYRVGTAANAVLDVGNQTALATLTIEAGVTLKFLAGGILRVDTASGTNPASGALIAVGTASAPIVFTSAAATPAAGDWYGVWFGQAPAPTSRMDHTRVEYAGQLSGSGFDSCIPMGQTGPNDAAIRIAGGIPASAFVTNTTIRSSRRHGIDRGYRAATNIDFTATNTFIDVPGCPQTQNRDPNGACPTTGSSCP